MNRRLRFTCWVALVATLLAGQIGWLYSLRGARLLEHDRLLIAGWIALGVVILAVALLLRTTPSNAIRIGRVSSAAIVVAGAALLQVAAIALLSPVLSDDVVRCRLDGGLWLSGDSPYATTPNAAFARASTDTTSFQPDSIDCTVDHPDLRTLHPPLSEAVFALGRALELATLKPMCIDLSNNPNQAGTWRTQLLVQGWESRIWPFRVLFGGLAIATTALLVAILRDLGRSPWWAVLFAWNPLVVVECGAMAHADVAGAFLVLLAIRASMTLAKREIRPARSAVFLALACGIKPVAILLLPWLWRRTHETAGFHSGRKMVLVFAAVAGLLLLPPLLHQHGWHGWMRTGGEWAGVWHANGSLFELLTHAIPEPAAPAVAAQARVAAQLLALVILLIAALLLYQGRVSAAEAGYWLFLTAGLGSAVVSPWHLVGPLALLPLLPRALGWAGLVWSATIALTYLPGSPLHGTAGRPAPVIIWQYIPVYAVLLIELAWIGSRRIASAPSDPTPKALPTPTGRINPVSV